MPIKPPNLDDRRYADILAEARRLIPQYCPEWTNLSDADPGMTLVQLFAWMTELTIYRLNRVPDKTYVHFLNFIGEERKRARPAVGPVTFTPRVDRPVELPPFTRCATRQREDNQALEFVTTDRLTVHDARVVRIMAVKGGRRPAVREIPFTAWDDHPAAVAFANGRGVQFFDLDPVEFGPDAYTPHQFLYLAHDDFRLMDVDPAEGRPVGRLRVRRPADGLSLVPFFRWEYPTAEGWMPIETVEDDDEQLGMPELALETAMPGILPIDFSMGGSRVRLPEPIAESRWWVRGRLAWEEWLAARMEKDLEVSWKDDRGGEERRINNWEVRARGRTLEFVLQDLPPIKAGWTLRMALVDRGVQAGRSGTLPNYRWFYRRGESWEPVPAERVRVEKTLVVLTGPLPDMATDGVNLRAERVETAWIRNLAADLEVDLNWMRPVEVVLAAGEDPRRVERLPLSEAPWSPFQISPIIPPTIGRRLYIGSDLFENRPQAPVLMELEVGFEMNGELVEEPAALYDLQLTYRAEDSWRVVWSEDKVYSKFTFSTLDEEGGKRAAKRKIRIVLDPKTQLRGLARDSVGELETTWLRLELIKSSLTGQDEKKVQHPIALKVYGIRLGVDKTIGSDMYEQPMTNPKMAQLDYRDQNQRLTRLVTRETGRLSEFFPFYDFVQIEDDNQALYLQFDKPLPAGSRHALQFRCRGEAFLPEGVSVEWELLEDRGHGRTGWVRLQGFADAQGQAGRSYDLSASGVLEFPLPEVPDAPEDGFWLRGRFVLPGELQTAALPPLPPVTHILLNTVDAVALYTVRSERSSGLGVPNQSISLLRRPLYLHPGEGERPLFRRPDQFDDIKVLVEDDRGEKVQWKRVDAMTTTTKDDRVFTVDPVDGTLTFGNGINGRMLPVGSNNVIVEAYRVVPGARSNVGPHEIVVVEGASDAVDVTNLLPASGGRDAETISEIVRRAPSILTSRDRAVTRADFEIIAKEASGEIARAACEGSMDHDGRVEVIILPHRREGEAVPDPFLGAGLRDHVSRYLKRRCLVNVDPVVRLATFLPIDVSVELRLRPTANSVQVREAAEKWVRRFLDPYTGGLDAEGWPFKGTLYAADFARLVSDLPEVRHVVQVALYDMSKADPRAEPGWNEGDGSPSLVLGEHDLFVVRRVRVRTEELGE